MRFQSYFNHALTIIGGYDGAMPLSPYLKQYFAGHKKHGSTDRKMIAHACYSYYRLGHAMKGRPPKERLQAALFLCSEDPAQWKMAFDKEEWATQDVWLTQGVGGSGMRIEKVREQYPSFLVEDIFPWKEELSQDIDHHAFCLSFLRQPDLFLRIRPGHEAAVLQKLGATPVFIPPFTLRLPNGSKVEEFFTPDKEIVVQDYSSQRLAPFLQLPDRLPAASQQRTGSSSPQASVWDACAASGGKSILAYDLDPDIELTVSDIRDSILHNLDRRFLTAGIKNYHSFRADLAKTGPLSFGRSTLARSSAPMPGPLFDLIIADLPCTGSGTWARNPEELFFFDPAKITAYRQLQEKIVSNLIPHLGKKARFVYSTCSVFKKENEEMAAFIGDRLGLRSDRMEYIKGYDEKADSMFAARFIS